MDNRMCFEGAVTFDQATGTLKTRALFMPSKTTFCLIIVCPNDI